MKFAPQPEKTEILINGIMLFAACHTLIYLLVYHTGNGRQVESFTILLSYLANQLIPVSISTYVSYCKVLIRPLGELQDQRREAALTCDICETEALSRALWGLEASGDGVKRSDDRSRCGAAAAGGQEPGVRLLVARPHLETAKNMTGSVRSYTYFEKPLKNILKTSLSVWLGIVGDFR